MAADALPDPWTMTFATVQVVDWTGPIVETVFHRSIETQSDVDTLWSEATEFMTTVVAPRAEKAFFLTCYDGFRVARDLLGVFQDGLVAFNERFSKGDARYGGSDVARMILISTSIRSARSSNLHGQREEALASLRKEIRHAADPEG